MAQTTDSGQTVPAVPADLYAWKDAFTDALVDEVLTATVKLIGWEAFGHASRNGGDVFPGLARLAPRCGCSEKTVSRALKTLVALGFLIYVSRGGKGKASVYRLALPAGTAVPAPREAEDDAEEPTGGAPAPGDAEESQAPQEAPTASQRPAPRARRTPLPDDFTATPGMREWAAENAPRVDVGHATKKFRDYHRDNGTMSPDWDASWRKWVGNERSTASAAPARGAEPVATPDGEIVVVSDDDVERVLGRDVWSPPAPPEEIEPGTRAYIEWMRNAAAERKRERRQETARRLACTLH